MLTIECGGGRKVTVEVAMQWNDSYNESVLCYTNNIPQKMGELICQALDQA